MTPLIRAVVSDIRKKVSPAIIAARFHNTLIEMITMVTEEIREAAGIGKVVLTGGAFQNSILLAGTEEMLEKKGFEVFRPLEFPVNDGGIALGQLAVAGWRKMEA